VRERSECMGGEKDRAMGEEGERVRAFVRNDIYAYMYVCMYHASRKIDGRKK